MRDSIFTKTIITLFLTSTLVFAAFGQRADTSKQWQGEPVQKERLLKVLHSGVVSPLDIVSIIETNGVDFDLTRPVEAELKAENATDEILRAVRNNRRGANTKASARGQSPTVGKYTGINAETFEPYNFDLTISAGGKYEQNGEIGKFSYDSKTGKIEWLTGPMPKQWLGFFYKAGDQFENGHTAKDDTIVIRDRKDLTEGNRREIIWFNCCAQ